MLTALLALNGRGGRELSLAAGVGDGAMANELARKLRKQMAPQEIKLWSHLRPLRRGGAGWKFRRQVPLRGYIADFACFEARLVIEVDGSQHGVEDHWERDRVRDEILERGGFAVLRFWNAQVDREFEGVWQLILGALQNAELRRRWFESDMASSPAAEPPPTQSSRCAR